MMHSSLEWAALRGHHFTGVDGQPTLAKPNLLIEDPDGWDRKNLWQSLNEPITEREYQKRICASTCIPLTEKGQNYPFKEI